MTSKDTNPKIPSVEKAKVESQNIIPDIEQPLPTNTLTNTELVYYYGYLVGQLQYEGSGIWNRFNIMMGINGSLFVLMTFLHSASIDGKDLLILIVCFGGLLFSIWSIFVLRKLWEYHYHWKDQLEELEKKFPTDIIKPFTGTPKKKKRSKFKAWFKSYTQPFFYILVIIWLAIIIFNFSTIKRHNHKTETTIKTQSILKDSTMNIQKAKPQKDTSNKK